MDEVLSPQDLFNYVSGLEIEAASDAEFLVNVSRYLCSILYVYMCIIYIYIYI